VGACLANRLTRPTPAVSATDRVSLAAQHLALFLAVARSSPFHSTRPLFREECWIAGKFTQPFATTGPIHRRIPRLDMRSFLLLAFVAMATWACAIPITPSAPRWQRRAEQFRLQGLREFEIAERLTTGTASTAPDAQPFLSRLDRNLHHYLHAPSTDDEPDLSGDVAPGSAAAPQILPTAPLPDNLSLFERLFAAFHRKENGYGYEGKESEMRRPIGMVYWKQFGGFRR